MEHGGNGIAIDTWFRAKVTSLIELSAIQLLDLDTNGMAHIVIVDLGLFDSKHAAFIHDGVLHTVCIRGNIAGLASVFIYAKPGIDNHRLYFITLDYIKQNNPPILAKTLHNPPANHVTIL
jgi:hypothetical protein